jgi:hypothetical protein
VSDVRRGKIGLDLGTIFDGLGQKVDMHLVGPDLRALMAEIGKVQRIGIILGLTEGERHADPVVITANEDVVGPRQGRAADQRVDAVQVTAARGPAPIMEGLVEHRLRADNCRLVGRAPMATLDFHFAHPHGLEPR